MYAQKYRQSNRVAGMKYAIRDLVVLANELERKGKRILKLNIGDPIQFDYETPEEMINGVCQAVRSNKNYYADSLGIRELRSAIALHEGQKHGVTLGEDDIMFTSGVSEAIYFLFASFTEVGDELLLPAPTYPAYSSLATVFQTKVRYYSCIEEDGWQPDLDDLRNKITDKTRFVVSINPNNPTGAVYSEKTMREIINIVGEHHSVLISDEIYDDLVIDGNRPPGVARVSNDVPAIVFNGFSKSFLAPGWRAGYAYRWDPDDKIADVWEGMKKVARARLSATTPIEYGCLAALQSDRTYLPALRDKLRKRRDVVVKHMNASDLFDLAVPKAAFYAFPRVHIENMTFRNDEEFVVSLLKETGVLVVYGSGFGESPVTKDHFRIVYLANEETLESALSLLVDFAEKHRK